MTNDQPYTTPTEGVPANTSATPAQDVWSFLSPQTSSSVFPGSSLGLLINRLSNGRLLAFPDQHASFDAVATLGAGREEPSTDDAEKTAMSVQQKPSSITGTTSKTTRNPHTPSETSLGRSQSLAANDTRHTLVDAAGTGTSLHIPMADIGPIYLAAGGTEPDGKDPGRLKRFATSFEPGFHEAKATDASHDGDHDAATVDVPPPADKIVGWYSPNDPENPQNWPRSKKLKFTTGLMLLTFTVYLSSAIYVAAGPGVKEHFHANNVHVELGISAFILGYAIGPLFICPFADFPYFGRNGVYIPATLLFTAFSILAAFANNYAALILGRFWSGFFGSPALSLAAASLSDVWHPGQLPYAMAVWSVGAVGGPTLGPLMGGFIAMNVYWRWPLYLVCILGAVCTAALFAFLPESGAQTILYQRAKRLRKSTGDTSYRAQSEIDAAKIHPGQLAIRILTRPFVLCVDPAALYCHLLLGIAYGCFWLDFESFPLVFQGIYGFNLGELGLPFIGLLLALAVALVGYVWYLRTIAEPRFMRTGKIAPEERLEVALVATFLIPFSLFIYGWTARPDVSYWGPVIGGSLVLPGVFLLYQAIFTYLPLSYAASGDAPSIMASNAFFRSIIAAAFPLFGKAYYERLGLGKGSTILACIYFALYPFLWVLYLWGDKVRAASRYASKD